MFFIKTLSHKITLAPKYLGPHLHHHLLTHLYHQKEGTCSGTHGHIISIISIEEIGEGVVGEGGGCLFECRFRAVVERPFKGECVDACVGTVNKMGFFASVGPLQIFVSSHLIPDHLKFDPNSVPPAYISNRNHDGQYDEDEEGGDAGLLNESLQAGDNVRLRIVGTRVDATEMFAIGSIKEDYLGVIN